MGVCARNGGQCGAPPVGVWGRPVARGPRPCGGDLVLGALSGGTFAFSQIALSARLSAPVAIGDRDRVGVHHRGLDTRPGTHIDTDLFPHKAPQQKCRGGQDRDGHIGHRSRVERDQIKGQLRCIGKVEHPRPACRHRNPQPKHPFGDAQAQFACAPARVMQSDAGIAVALDPAFDKDEQIGPDRLRAGITTPHTPQSRGKQKQPKPRHDQQTGDEIEFMGPDLDPEEIEPPMRQIDQHRLIRQVGPAVPPQPRGEIIYPQRNGHDTPLKAAEEPVDAARKNRHSRGIKRWR